MRLRSDAKNKGYVNPKRNVTMVQPSGENVSESQPPGDYRRGTTVVTPVTTDANVVTPVTTVPSMSIPTVMSSTDSEAVVSLQTIKGVQTTPGVTLPMRSNSTPYMPSFTLQIRDHPFGMSTAVMGGLHTNSSMFSNNAIVVQSPLNHHLASGYAINNPIQFHQPQVGTMFASQPFPSITTGSIPVMRQQMDENNHEMVNMLTHQMGTVLDLILEITNHTCNNWQPKCLG